MVAADDSENRERDAPLRDDVRHLGRILGETVRSQEGEGAFELIEKIRQTALRFHRNAEAEARQELQSTISSLPTEQAGWVGLVNRCEPALSETEFALADYRPLK